MIERGSVVRHIPSGEEWAVVHVDRGLVFAAGWPPSAGKIADCEQICTCEDVESMHGPFGCRSPLNCECDQFEPRRVLFA